MTLTHAEAVSAAAPFLALRAAMSGAFLERSAEIDGILLAMIARQHVLLLGPPGTAKSALSDAIARAIPSSSYFVRLMGRFTLPEELFGPTSIAGLREDRFERKTAGFLPRANVAFLDEIFKANSAILNSLLTLINERKFDNGTTREDCPLDLMIGASNELPDSGDEALDALYDRFVLRFWVRAVAERGSKRALLRMRGAPVASATLTAEDLATARAAVARVEVPADVEDALIDAVEALDRELGIAISDRRLRKVGGLVRARALLSGRAVATVDDVMILVDSAWTKPDERAKVVGVVTRIIAPSVAEALKLLDAATEERAKVGAGHLSPDAIKVAAQVKIALETMSRNCRALPSTSASQAEGVEAVAAKIDALVVELVRAISESFRPR